METLVETPAPTTAAARKKNGRLCPDFVCRVSGLPTACVDDLRAHRTVELLNRVLELDVKLERQKETVSQVIHERIGGLDNQKIRRQLLKLRRDLFNKRGWSETRRTTLEQCFEPDSWAVICGFHSLLAELQNTLAALEVAYKGELAQLRQQFREALHDTGFQKGLLLSSNSLFSQLPRYLTATGNLNGKLEQTERGLLRYYTRMAMKATPFGTFCTVNAGTFTAEPLTGMTVQLLQFSSDPRRKRSVVRINKRLYGVLLEHLKTRPIVRRSLLVELNPTLSEKADRLVFLSGLQGREVFQRVAHNSVLDVVTHEFEGRSPIQLSELIALLSTSTNIEATDNEAVAYLGKLLDIGFLRVCTGIPEQEIDWDLPFKTFLESIEDDHARHASVLLAEVRQASIAYATATVTGRVALAETARKVITAAFDAMDIQKADVPNPIWYEDATSDCQIAVASVDVSGAVDSFLEYAGQLLDLAWLRGEQATMRHFFESFYGADIQRVPLLKFYEDYYREHAKDHMEKQLQSGSDDAEDKDELSRYDFSNPFGLEFVRRLNEAREGITEVIRERWAAAPDAVAILLRKDDLTRCLKDVPQRNSSARSISVFAWPVAFEDRGRTLALVVRGGSYVTGYGKFFSRFLHLLPESVHASIYRQNESLSRDLLAEICGDANFNANLHPPLLPWELSYPTGESGEAKRQLKSSNIEVVRDEADSHALSLIHSRLNKRILPVDLGFLNPTMRPPFYRLLCRFQPPSQFAVGIPDTVEAPVEKRERKEADEEVQGKRLPGSPESEHESAAGATPQVIRRPRITYEGRIILALQRWVATDSAFPAPEPQEAAWEYFVRVNRWRTKHGLPNEVFVRITPKPVSDSKRATTHEKPVNREPTQRHPAEVAGPAMSAVGESAPADSGQGRSTSDVQATAPNEVEQLQDKSLPRDSRDFYKPQYIAFTNPLLVKLLGKMTVTLPRFSVSFEERLPSSDDLPHYKGEQYSTELIMQFDFADSPGSVRG